MTDDHSDAVALWVLWFAVAAVLALTGHAWPWVGLTVWCVLAVALAALLTEWAAAWFS